MKPYLAVDHFEPIEVEAFHEAFEYAHRIVRTALIAKLTRIVLDNRRGKRKSK
jgi:hypothetical protein